ncbi:MAG: TonB-dependent receptor [Proteobacteria bacterium]|nr:TonB-dependent receptor [Pseudomonadota bacterium]
MRANRSSTISLTLAAAASAAALPGAVLAAGDNSSGGLEEIVVTANKLNAEKVLDIPVSIQAISGDTLQREGASGIMSIAGSVPGLSVQDLGPGDKKYVIRGINSTGDSTIGVYYGEAVISGTNGDDGGGFQPDIRLYDLDRIEVLRGPQGTLYGASSMSGTIRFVPKMPDLNVLGGYITLEGSKTAHANGNNYNINGELNLPVIDGQLAVRMVGWKLYDAGYVNQTRVGAGVTANDSNGVPQPVKPLGYVPGVNWDDVGGGRVELRYQPTENLTIDANVTSQSEHSGGSSRWTPAGVQAFSGGPIPPIEGCDLCNTDVTISPWSDNIKIFGLTAAYKIRGGTFTATTNQFNRDTAFSFDSTPVLVSFDVPVPAETLEPRTRKVNNTEVRFASDLDSPVNFVVGAYRQHETQDLAVQVITTGANGLVTGPFSTETADDALDFPGVGNTFFGRTDSREDTQWAGFGEATWKIDSHWTAIAGIRYFTETLNGVQTQTHPFGGFPGDPNLVPIYDPQETFDKVTWKANLSYKFDNGMLVYGTVSTGFRGGGLNAVSEPFEPIPPAFEPDTLTNYEAGFKGRLFEGLFDYQLDAYFIKWDNMQVQLTTADGAFVYTGNVGAADVKGVEFEFNAHPIDYLTGTLSGSWQDAKVTESPTEEELAANPTLPVDGMPIPNVPKFQFYAALNYTRPISGTWQGVAAADVTYRGSTEAYFRSNSLYNLSLPAYTLVDLRLGVINGPWTANVFVRNLTDERAQVSAINSSQDPHGLLTVQPRTIGINLTRTF